MSELDDNVVAKVEAAQSARAPSDANPTHDVIAEPQASEQTRRAFGFGARSSEAIPAQRFSRKLMVAASLTGAIAAVVLGGALIYGGVSQLREGGQRQAAEQTAKQRQAEQVAQAQASLDQTSQAPASLDQTSQVQASQVQTSQVQASKEASEQAAIPEGKLVSADIANLKSMRAELAATLAALKHKAKSSASASRDWDQAWDRRQSSYSSRYSAVSAHNASERRRYLASQVEVARNGRLVVKYTYHPSYEGYPGRPGKPAPLKVSLDAERKRLVALRARIDALGSAIASQAAAAHSLGSVYPVVDRTAKALGATVGKATRVASTAVVSKGDKGRVVDASKVSTIKLGELDAPFAELDRAFTESLTVLGLSAAQVSADATSP